MGAVGSISLVELWLSTRDICCCAIGSGLRLPPRVALPSAARRPCGGEGIAASEPLEPERGGMEEAASAAAEGEGAAAAAAVAEAASGVAAVGGCGNTCPAFPKCSNPILAPFAGSAASVPNPTTLDSGPCCDRPSRESPPAPAPPAPLPSSRFSSRSALAGLSWNSAGGGREDMLRCGTAVCARACVLLRRSARSVGIGATGWDWLSRLSFLSGRGSVWLFRVLNRACSATRTVACCDVHNALIRWCQQCFVSLLLLLCAPVGEPKEEGKKQTERTKKEARK